MKINILRWIGGIIVIILGLHLIGIIRIKFLFREKRFHIKKQSIGYFSSFLFGLVFAIGWTPCIGPILASILVLASTQETVYQGTTLLIIFSLGLGIPFLFTAMAINLSLKIFTKIKKFYRVIEIVSGCILIVVGILIITNNFQRITAYLLS